MTDLPGGARVYALGDSAAVVRWGDRIDPDQNRQVLGLARCLADRPFPGMVEVVPAYASLAVYYDPAMVARAAVHREAAEQGRGGRGPAPMKPPASGLFDLVCRWLYERVMESSARPEISPRTVVFPVCYGGEFGPDLDDVAARNGLTAAEAVALHAGTEYRVYLLGFTPGFPYLGGLSPRLATPRRVTPRMLVPAGAVGIAGNQTGIYPRPSPGGWQLIGRTPRQLFNPAWDPPALLQPGDRVRFAPVTAEEFTAWEEGGAPGEKTGG